MTFYCQNQVKFQRKASNDFFEVFLNFYRINDGVYLSGESKKVDAFGGNKKHVTDIQY